MTADGAPIGTADRRVVRRLLREVERGDAVAVHGIVEELRARSWTVGAVVTTYLAGAALEIGRRWQEGRWSVAQEHAAIAIIDAELALLEHAMSEPTLDTEVLVVCAEGEWHDTPARMAALVMREYGFRVRLVGASVPADELDRTLDDHPPDVIAVSCTFTLALAGATSIATIARRRGIPTLAGGAGFGASPHRALRLGLDAWAAMASEGAEQILAWRAGSPPVRDGHGPAVDLDALEDRWRVMADEVLDRLLATEGILGPADRPLTPLHRDLVDLLRAAHLTALCEDPALFTDHIDRLQTSPARRGLPPAAIPSTIEILRELAGIYQPADVETNARIDEAARSWAPSTADSAPVLGQSAMIARTMVEVEDPELLGMRLIGLATEIVHGCDHVGFLLLEHGERESAVHSSRLAQQVEDLEREHGEGPATEAIERREVVESVDLTTEVRWPAFAAALVARTSIRSVLAIPLTIRGHLLGVLELFADSVHAFETHDRSVAESFGTHAAIALHAAIQQRTLQEAIDTRDVIGQAKGILMEREGVDEDGAFELLRAISNRTNTKLRDVAAYVVRNPER